MSRAFWPGVAACVVPSFAMYRDDVIVPFGALLRFVVAGPSIAPAHHS